MIENRRWSRERDRFRMLAAIYERTGPDCAELVHAGEVGEALGFSAEQTFRVIHFLESRGYLSYRGAGPRVCITETGIEYLESKRGRRSSIRDD